MYPRVVPVKLQAKFDSKQAVIASLSLSYSPHEIWILTGEEELAWPTGRRGEGAASPKNGCGDEVRVDAFATAR